MTQITASYKKVRTHIKQKPIPSLVLLIIIISFILKLLVGFYFKDSFFNRGNSSIALNAIALNLINNHEYSIIKGIPSIDYEPLYPSILAISYKLFSYNWFGVTFIQGILFGFTSYFLFLIGREVWNEQVGLIAAIYHSFYPYLFFHSLSVFDTTQYIFVITMLLYFILRNEKKYLKIQHYAAIGCMIGLSILSRGSAIAILPPVILYIFIKSLNKGFFKNITIMLTTTLIVLSPWLIRNYYYTQKIIMSTHGPFGLWQGNNQYSYNCLKNNISCDEIYRMKPPPEIYQKFPIKSRPPIESIKVAEKYKNEAFRFIRNNPDEFMRLCRIKFVKFWSWTYNPVDSSYTFGSLKIRQLIYFISYIPLLFSIPSGLFFLSKKSKINFLLFSGILITYTVAHVIVMGFSRLRLPLDLVLMILFGITISTIYLKIQNLLRYCD